MKKIMSLVIAITIVLTPLPSYAIGWRAILNVITKMYGVNVETRDFSREQLEQLKVLKDSVTGTHSYGKQFHDKKAYAWGSSTGSWQNVLALAKAGGGAGALGMMIKDLSSDFPISKALNSKNEIENMYYDLQANTALSSRSASALAYQQAVKGEKTMNHLHKLIDNAPDAKSAADLSNRFASEQVITSVQQTKLLAMLVQQSAINAQEKANRAREDMAFFAVQ